jgi:hypothetical protein
MMHVYVSSQPMKVWLDAKPFTKVTRKRTQPCIASMHVVILVAKKDELSQL